MKTFELRGDQLAILINDVAEKYQLPEKISKEILSKEYPEDVPKNVGRKFYIDLHDEEKDEFTTLLKAIAGYPQTEKNIATKLNELATMVETN
jgi:hypothetical protein